MGNEIQTPSVKFYLVDDVPVCIWNDGNEASGFVLTTGYPYPPLKAASEGHEISINQIADEVKVHERRTT